MLWSEILFGVKKPIIAMLHLDPLPGDPRFRPNTAMNMPGRTCRRCRRAAWTGC